MAINLACKRDLYGWQVIDQKHFFVCANLLVSCKYTNKEVNLFYFDF